jgi:2,4-dienoyl-CoA reductase-like NADH-dependent reductase (Old Yellow Enzyme family)
MGSYNADLVAFGRPFIAKPEFTEKIAQKASLNENDPESLWRRRSLNDIN